LTTNCRILLHHFLLTFEDFQYLRRKKNKK
jgi:hypothetical protein